VDNNASFCAVIVLSCEDDVLSVGKRPADAFEGFSAQDDRMAPRQRVKVLPVGRKVPWYFITSADHSVFGHGRNKGNDQTLLSFLLL
jgi:hypothetical protein